MYWQSMPLCRRSAHYLWTGPIDLVAVVVLVILEVGVLATLAGVVVTVLMIMLQVRVLVIQKGTRVLISLWDSLMFGRVPGTRPNISESQNEIGTRVPVFI